VPDVRLRGRSPAGRQIAISIGQDEPVDDPKRTAIASSWRRQMERPCPPGLRGEEIHGVDMVMLDADVAGCVQSWLKSSFDLDVQWVRILRTCLDALDRVLPELSDQWKVEYYSGFGISLARCWLSTEIHSDPTRLLGDCGRHHRLNLPSPRHVRTFLRST